MKRLLAILFLPLFLGNFAFADGDLWDNFGDTNVYGQKAVSDQDFEKALESKRKKKKKRNKDIPKGESFSQSNETNELVDTTKEPSILLIPVTLKLADNSVVPVGHYGIEGVKEDGKVFLKLYQGHTLTAKIPAEETNDDFGEQTINFVKLIPHGDYHVQIIYGGVDFNAYSVIETE